jgi:hypothetical protein
MPAGRTISQATGERTEGDESATTVCACRDRRAKAGRRFGVDRCQRDPVRNQHTWRAAAADDIVTGFINGLPAQRRKAMQVVHPACSSRPRPKARFDRPGRRTDMVGSRPASMTEVSGPPTG